MPDENLLTTEPNFIGESASNSRKPNGVPEKFWDAKTEEIRVDALLASYLALEKKLATMLPAPQNDADRRRLQKILGVPDKASDYRISVPNDLFDVDESLNERLLEKGFTEAQAQEVYDLAAEKLVPLIVEMAAEFEADREVERLVAHFGGADQWRGISRQLLSFGRKNLAPDVLNGLACSYDGVMALHRMMKGESAGMKAKGVAQDHAGEGELHMMMKNPKYWREKDPSFIARVTEGFERLYKS
jgi:hypothetical protein